MLLMMWMLVMMLLLLLLTLLKVIMLLLMVMTSFACDAAVDGAQGEGDGNYCHHDNTEAGHAAPSSDDRP
jgi:hypothetical protein